MRNSQGSENFKDWSEMSTKAASNVSIQVVSSLPVNLFDALTQYSLTIDISNRADYDTFQME